MSDDVTGQVTGLIPTVLALGILKKTSEMSFGTAKAKPFPKLFKK
jgi:hypothetical protein